MINKKASDTELATLRGEIDKCDKEIVRLLNRRFELVRQVGQYKITHNLPLYDETREKEVVAGCQALSNFPVAEIFETIMEQARRVQMKIRDEDHNGNP